MGIKINIALILFVIAGISYEVGKQIGKMKLDTTPYYWGIGIAGGCTAIGILLVISFFNGK